MNYTNIKEALKEENDLVKNINKNYKILKREKFNTDHLDYIKDKIDNLKIEFKKLELKHLRYG